jgi:hypothetical protein
MIRSWYSSILILHQDLDIRLFIGCHQFAVYRDQWFDPRMEAQSTRNSRNPLMGKPYRLHDITLYSSMDMTNRDYQQMN